MQEESVFVLDGLPLSEVLQPRDVAQLGEIVRRAAAEKKAIYPFGSRVAAATGFPPVHDGLAVELTKLDQVIDYPAPDMTITVQIGIVFAKLQEILAAENQRLPIDVPLADQLTLGDALAANLSGARRYGFGTLRDYVIGISAVNDQGVEVKAGGRVVKNVAGYDLCKLYIGSLWTLGIMTQVTLKVKPRAEKSTLLAVHSRTSQLEALLDLLHASKTRSVAITLLNSHASQEVPGGTQDWLAFIGFEDNAEAVAWQLQQMRIELAQLGLAVAHEWSGAEAAPVWQRLANFPYSGAAPLSFKATTLPRHVAALCSQMVALAPELIVQVHAGNGVIHAHWPGSDLKQAQRLLGTLSETATASHGNVTIQRCRTEWKSSLPVWGVPRGDAWLMREVKTKLDPNGIFNPGRFVNGI
jgi:glycolate oxidase FAD binding subunit